MNRCSLALCAAVFLLVFGARDALATRYLDETFTAVLTGNGVPYGTTTTRCGGATPDVQTHLLDVYEPQGDVELERPVVVVVPGGGFVSESRTTPDIVAIAQALARRGYVAAVIDYRVCPGYTPAQLLSIVGDAQQDALAAVRFFRAFAMRWRVDPTRIMLAGFSAGAVTALTATYDAAAWPLTNDCCQNQPSNVCAIASLAGGTEPALIDAGEPPALLVHHIADTTVPVGSSYMVEDKCTAVGVPVEAHYLTTPVADGHFDIFDEIDDIMGWMAAFFYDHVIVQPGCGAQSGQLIESDFATSIPSHWVPYKSLGTGQVSIVAGAERSTVLAAASSAAYADAEINDWMKHNFTIEDRMPWQFVNIDFRLRTNDVNDCPSAGHVGSGVGTRGWGFWDGTVNNFAWFLSSSDDSFSCGFDATTSTGGSFFGTPVTVDMSQWHDYRIVWRPTGAEFYIDGVFNGSHPAPSVPMGLVFWLDNAKVAMNGSVSFIDVAADQYVEVDHLRVYTSRARFTDVAGADMTSYRLGTNVTVTIDDPDENLDRLQVETVSVVVFDDASGDSETLVLTETTASSGEFRASIPLAAGTPATNNGTLQGGQGDTLSLAYQDADDTGDTDFDEASVALTEDFTGTRSELWGYVIGGSGPSVAESGGTLQSSIPTTSTAWPGPVPLNAGFLASCSLGGDFDVQVDFSLTSPPAVSGSAGILAFPSVITAPVSLGGTIRSFVPAAYLTFVPSGSPQIVGTSDTTGKLRLRRTGATAQGYYDSGGVWTPIGAPIAFSTGDTRISLHLSQSSATAQTTAATFDNFVASAQHVTCPFNQLCGDGNVNPFLDETCDDANETVGDGCCACRSEPLPAAPDVTGRWQLSITCPESLTTVQTLTLAQTPGSPAATVSPEGCATYFGTDGQIHPVSSCNLTGSNPAQVCGTTFAYRAPQDDAHVTPFAPAPGSLGNCTNLERIVSEHRLNGVISTDAQNRAVLISGAQSLDATELFNFGEVDPCLEVAGSFCSFELRRNSAAPGTNISVEPLAGVTVTLGAVSAETYVTVVPETSPAAVLPPNFQLVADGLGNMYFNVTPVGGAYGTGPNANKICFAYQDADRDGFIDGTNPPVDEDDLKVLHEQGGMFVDRTFESDPDANLACARFEDFSQFVLGAGDAPTPSTPSLCPGTPRTDCRETVKAGGSSLRVATDSKYPLIWKWRGAATAKDDFGDPLTSADYQLCLYDGIDGTPVSVTGTSAPFGGTCAGAPCWEEKETGYKYRDGEGTPDGLFQLQLKAGADGKAKISVKAKSPQVTVPPMPLLAEPNVTVQLVNSAGTCWSAQYGAPRKSDGELFKAKSD